MLLAQIKRTERREDRVEAGHEFQERLATLREDRREARLSHGKKTPAWDRLEDWREAQDQPRDQREDRREDRQEIQRQAFELRLLLKCERTSKVDR